MILDPHNKTIHWLKQQEYSFLPIVKAVKSEIRLSMWVDSGDRFFLACQWSPSHNTFIYWKEERERGKNNFYNLSIRSQPYWLKASSLWIRKPT